MIIQVLWIGKTKEHYAREGIKKYTERIKPFCEFEIIEIREMHGQDRNNALEKEGKHILQTVNDFVLLYNEGIEMNSAHFADFLMKRQKWSFVIGGPYGVSENVHNKARSSLSLSKMTFPHDLARVMFLEQIYRGLTIINRRGYHH